MVLYVISQETHERVISIRKDGELMYPYIRELEGYNTIPGNGTVLRAHVRWAVDNMLDGDSLVVSFSQTG